MHKRVYSRVGQLREEHLDPQMRVIPDSLTTNHNQICTCDI
jgi:hypothetical protein